MAGVILVLLGVSTPLPYTSFIVWPSVAWAQANKGSEDNSWGGGGGITPPSSSPMTNEELDVAACKAVGAYAVPRGVTYRSRNPISVEVNNELCEKTDEPTRCKEGFARNPYPLRRTVCETQPVSIPHHGPYGCTEDSLRRLIRDLQTGQLYWD